MRPDETLVRGLVMEATRRTLSRSGNPRFNVQLKMPDGEMRTYPTKTDADVNYDIENVLGKEVTFVIDAQTRIVYLQDQ